VLSLSRPKPPAASPLLDPATLALESARSPDEVVAALVAGLAPARTLVLAVRSSSFVGREGSPEFSRAAVRGIDVLASSPSVLQTAMRAGSYLGALPHTPAHAGLRELFGDSDDEVYVALVTTSGHAALVIVCDAWSPGSDTGAGTRDATERIDALAKSAGQALERILLRRKRGG
jgi:hypothetical protein